jgi:effector-binding domain-containing protein
LKIDIYWNSLRNQGILFWFTKNPAKSINGIIRTGVSVTASCLSENIVPIIKAYPDDALYIKKSITTKKYNDLIKWFTYRNKEICTK